ncbi:MAG: integrase [Tateyamaria sp.]|nr:integrase [Tateyamaria sp.]MBT6343036.1 integrase [Tateyamaria sp.]
MVLHLHLRPQAKLDEWERFYSFVRPHGAHNEKNLYEALRDQLQ